MRGQSVSVRQEVDFFIEECCNCGVMFGMTEYFKEERVGDKQTFYCPNGHPQSYMGESHAAKAKRLERELERTRIREQAARDQAEAAERRRIAAQGQLTKTKKKLSATEQRVAHGVCPCCNRQFKNVESHMKNKHPDYVKENSNG